MNTTSIVFSLAGAFACLLPSAAQAQSAEYSVSAEMHSTQAVEVITTADSYPAALSQTENQVYSAPFGAPSTPMRSTVQPQAAVCTTG